MRLRVTCIRYSFTTNAPVRVRFVPHDAHPSTHPNQKNFKNSTTASQRAQSIHPFKRPYLYDSSADLKSSTCRKKIFLFVSREVRSHHRVVASVIHPSKSIRLFTRVVVFKRDDSPFRTTIHPFNESRESIRSERVSTHLNANIAANIFIANLRDASGGRARGHDVRRREVVTTRTNDRAGLKRAQIVFEGS